MGFFDRFKGESAAGKKPHAPDQQAPPHSAAPRLSLADIAKAYGLKEKESYEPSIEGTWWEGETGVTRFAVMENRGRLFVHIGTIAEIAEIYLGRATAQRPLPPEGSPGRIAGIVQGHGAGRQFCLLAYPQGTFDLPLLRQRGVADALVRLSPFVNEVMIYDNYQGATLLLEGGYARADFDRDLAAGVELVQAIMGQ
ncbi:MAG: hypothetical protein OEW15_05860 [Nitrospirota bacterium]|nr:hypothetical protein [Nitrospirota bacterium]